MKTLERFISSSVTTIVLLLIYAFGLAIATFIEKYHGTAAAKAATKLATNKNWSKKNTGE